jgi:anti-anti-sigma regulatory factor
VGYGVSLGLFDGLGGRNARILGAAYLVAHNRKGVIKLANLSPRVDEVLRITGLKWLFNVLDSETEAIEAFSRSSTAVTTS